MTAPAPELERWQTALFECRDNPLLFATDVLGFLPVGADNPDELPQLEVWQEAFLRDFTKHPRHSVRSGHGVGKGATIAILALWFPILHYDSKCVVTANSQSQLRDNNWPEIKKWARMLPEPLRNLIQIDEERLYIKAEPEMAFVVRRTATKHKPEALQGIHAKHVLYLVDEASGIDDIVFEVAEGSLSTEGAMAALFSNPTRSSGFFHATHHRLRERWRCWHVSSEDVPRARGHIEDVIKGYGKNSNRYRVRVQGDFPNADDQTVMPLELVMAAKGREVSIENVWPVWGADVGRHGDDPSALIKRQGNHLLGAPREWHNLDGAQVAGRIIAEYDATPNDAKPREIVVDVIGIGASVYDILRLEGSPVKEITRGCNVAESPAVSEEDQRLRDELWFRGRAWFADRKCYLPDNLPNAEDAELMEKLIGELTAPTYDFTNLGKRKVEGKRDLKARGVASPNLADAFLLTLAAGVHPRDNPHRTRRDQNRGTSWLAA